MRIEEKSYPTLKPHSELAVWQGISYSRSMKKLPELRHSKAWLIAGLLAVTLLPVRESVAARYAIDDNTAGSLTVHYTNEEDNLYELSRRFNIGLVEMLAANPGVDVWQPEPSTRLIIPTAHILPDVPRKGIVINLSELRLYYYPDSDPEYVYTFPIGIGREGWKTPLGQMKVARKRKDPDWIPPASIRKEDPDLPAIVPAGPDNPMGAYAIYLGTGSYAIHGTNRPYGIGKRSSHGCIRMYPEDIEVLFDLVKEGTKVTIIDKPYAIGWRGDNLYMTVTPTQEQADVISEEYAPPVPVTIPEIYDEVKRVAKDAPVNWYAVEDAMGKQSGVPVLIAKRE
jgi:L,D-transpeptidase ErfK/SrfK